jgi:hypothetical protein
MDNDRREALLREYGEVSSNFRELTEIRFKLLGLLPLAAGAAAAILPRGQIGVETLALSLFGLVVTTGLVSYNTRNDQLYDELVGRAAAIERYVGLPDGAFANRPRDWFRIPVRSYVWKVDHRTAIGTIYYSSIALWLFGVFAAAGELLRRAYNDLGLGRVVNTDASSWIKLIAITLAIACTTLAARTVRAMRDQAENALRVNAAAAVRFAETHATEELMDPDFLSLCERLSAVKRRHLEARIGYLIRLHPDSMAQLVAPAAGDTSAAQVVAAITDLPPGWLFDCRYSRRRKVEIRDAKETSRPGETELTTPAEAPDA